MDWPGVAKDVKDLCALCPICQKAGPAIIVKAPLNPLPIIKEPFTRIAMDVCSMTYAQEMLCLYDCPRTGWPTTLKLREEIRTLLDQEIIRPSKNPWAAPIVLVKKKDGTQRMCGKQNKVTINDPYPLPKDLIANIDSSIFITTLDLTKGYYQVSVNPQHREKTAFVTPYGKYEFLIMPFGLISVPSTFQRLMDGLLNGLHDFTVAYLDVVIIIHSDTWENYLNHMEIVFDELREAG